MTTTSVRPTNVTSTPEAHASDAPQTTGRQSDADTQSERAAGSTSRSARARPKPTLCSPSGLTSPAAEVEAIPQDGTPQGTSTTGRQGHLDVQDRNAAGSNVQGPAAIPSTTPTNASLLDPALCLAADIVDDLERVRIANENRIRQLTRTETDSDGEERGFGLDDEHPDVVALGLIVAVLKQQEHKAVLNLQRKLRKHPLGAWGKAQCGVGEKQLARLLAAIGDPYVNSAKDAPRTVSALWAYCGLHVLPVGHASHDAQVTIAGRNQPPADQAPTATHGMSVGGVQHGDLGQGAHDTRPFDAGVAAKRRKGERANWSTKAKMRAYLIAESCVKQLDPDCRDGHRFGDAHVDPAVAAPNGRDGQLRFDAQGSHVVPACPCSPYRVTYDQRRAHTATTHPEWTDGHSHNDALRVASKEILKHLWRAAREWHLEADTR